MAFSTPLDPKKAEFILEDDFIKQIVARDKSQTCT